jgi:predicted porin
LDSGGLNGSRFGFRGSEDLGGGLKANFQLENGYNIDTGTQAQGGLLFGRQAFVGLSGGFGEVRLGRQYSAYDELRGATNNTLDSAFAVTGYVWGAHTTNGTPALGAAPAVPPATIFGGDYNGRINNQLYYATPDFGGFSGAIGYGLGENKTATTKATDTLSLHAKYANGPILIGLAYQQEKLAANGSNKYTLIAGSYDFGVVKLTAGFNNAKRPTGVGTSEKDTEFQLGVSAPFGPATVALGLASAKVKDSPGTDTGKVNGFSGIVTYDLSKRTAFYTGFTVAKAKVSSPSAVGTVGKTQLFAVGVRHRF